MTIAGFTFVALLVLRTIGQIDIDTVGGNMLFAIVMAFLFLMDLTLVISVER